MSNGQAQMLNLGGGNLPPEILQQQQALNRQQQMAQLLMQQGQQMPSGQMVSGRFVAPSFFQYAAPLFQTYQATKLAEKGDKASLDLAKQLRQQYANEMAQFQDLLRGKEQTFEQAGPTQTGGNIPTQTYRAGGDPQAAYLFGSTAYNPVLQQVSAKKMLEGPKYKEVTQYNQQTGNTEIYRYDENSQNPRETMQFIGISKPAISPEAQIRFGDEGIGIPAQFRGGAVGQPQSQPTSAYGANVQFTPNQAVGAPQGQPSGQPQVTPNVAPTVASTKEYNPFIAPPVPVGLSGKQAREWKADQAKPLTGESEKQVSGAINYQKSLDNLQDIFGKYKGADLLKPNVRAEIQQSLNNALLQGKEANRLGVLNGPDLSILEKIVGDPTAIDALVKDRATLNKLYNNQRMFTAEVIKTNYRSSQKAVPENLREFVEVKPKELPKTEQKGQPKATGAVARAMLNGKPIVVRDGKWVDEKLGILCNERYITATS
jgi:hypothetical protein